jgi:LuxR family quorum sensing-dependent transcriptional regulator
VASEGKTDWEISVPTVAKHLLSARQRLDAMNTAHLIGEATRNKIIR